MALLISVAVIACLEEFTLELESSLLNDFLLMKFGEGEVLSAAKRDLLWLLLRLTVTL